MEKRKYSIIFLSAMSLMILIIFVLFTKFRLQKEKPYGMSDNYTMIIVHGPLRYISEDKHKSLHNQIKEVIIDKDITIVVDNINYIGLRIYDPQNKFGYSFLSDKYTNEVECPIAVKKNSYIHKNLIDKEDKFSYGENKFVIKSFYDSSDLLYSYSKDIITPYLYVNNTYEMGKYYIDTSNINIVNKVYFLLSELYDCSIEYNAGVEDFSISGIIYLIKNVQLYFTAFFGTLFTYVNFYLFYRFCISEDIKNINILMLFGANKAKIFMNFSEKIVPKLLIGSIVGVMAYFMIFRQSNLKLPMELIPILIISGLLLNYLCFSLAFSNQKMFKYHKEKAL